MSPATLGSDLLLSVSFDLPPGNHAIMFFLNLENSI